MDPAPGTGETMNATTTRTAALNVIKFWPRKWASASLLAQREDIQWSRSSPGASWDRTQGVHAVDDTVIIVVRVDDYGFAYGTLVDADAAGQMRDASRAASAKRAAEAEQNARFLRDLDR
jgi:hypothetical protein